MLTRLARVVCDNSVTSTYLSVVTVLNTLLIFCSYEEHFLQA